MPRPHAVPGSLAEAHEDELRPVPLDAPARRLWLDIERYLEFFAIVGADADRAAARAHSARPPRRLLTTRSMFEL